jgi:cyanophycinase
MNTEKPAKLSNSLTNENQEPKGVLVVIGGHENKGEEPKKGIPKGAKHPQEILKTFISLTEKDSPVIEVITSASSDGEESFKDYKRVFTELGIKEIGHIHHDKRSDVLHADFLDRIEKADGIFFSGGDQLKLTSIYGGTTLLSQLKERYVNSKLVLAGTSAGAMACSTPMIYAGNKELQQITGEVKITIGLEFLKDVCIDTHFVDRTRFVRMAQVIATNPSSIGIGLEEDTAMIVRRGFIGEVIGSGVAIIMEGFRITESNILEFGSGDRISIQDLNVHILGNGSFYNIPKNHPSQIH